MRFLLEKQNEFDKILFDPYLRRAYNRRAEKTNKVLLGIVMATSALYGADSEQIKNEIVPDLSICRAQLINTYMLKRYDPNILGESTGRVSKPEVPQRLNRSTAQLAEYCMYANVGGDASEPFPAQIIGGVVDLHVAVQSIAEPLGIDVEAEHEKRMRYLLGWNAFVLDHGALANEAE